MSLRRALRAFAAAGYAPVSLATYAGRAPAPPAAAPADRPRLAYTRFSPDAAPATTMAPDAGAAPLALHHRVADALATLPAR
jgi:hypothetical protein